LKRILYIGSHLSQGGGYPSVAESMAPLLLPKVHLHLVSKRKRKVNRIVDMLFAILSSGGKEQPVVIDVYSTLNFYYALLCGLLCWLSGISYICILRGGNLPYRLKRSPMMSRMLFGGARDLVAPSGYLQAAFLKSGYAVSVIPNFIPIENYPFKLRSKVEPRLLWVRAFDATYNPQMAIRVLHLLADKYPQAALCMVGPDKDGSMNSCRQLAQELGIADRVQFTGRLTKREWIELSSDYDLFINTTNFDNTPVSVIEAMALGLPVVSTNVGGVPYLIENGVNGCLIEKDNVEDMFHSLSSILDNPSFAEMLSQFARKKAKTFDWEEVKPLWLKLLIKYEQ